LEEECQQQHPAISGLFKAYADGRYQLRPEHRH
jgi:hypothetical protein